MVELRQSFEPISVRSTVGTGGKLGIELSGYAARFNVESYDLGGFTETIRQGAFATALRNKECGTVADSEHDQSRTFASVMDGTLRVWEDAAGLGWCAQMPNTPLGLEIIDEVRSGRLQNCSFAFADVQDSFQHSGGKNLRTISSIGRLIDVSVVANPAYPRTSVGIGDKPFARSLSFSLDAQRIRLIEVTCRH